MVSVRRAPRGDGAAIGRPETVALGGAVGSVVRLALPQPSEVAPNTSASAIMILVMVEISLSHQRASPIAALAGFARFVRPYVPGLCGE